MIHLQRTQYCILIQYMPCIRFKVGYGARKASTYPCRDPVSIRMKNQSYQHARWLGFVCEAAIEHIELTGYAKVQATDITNGDGVKCEWRSLKKGEHVLAVRIDYPIGEAYEAAVYGIVDSKGWPIIVGAQGLKRNPKLILVG